MPDDLDKEIGAIRLNVGLMKKDILIVNEVYRKLDITIDKMQDLTAAISKMLTMHENRLEYHEKKDDELDRMIENRRTELLSDIKELQLRTDELSDRVNDLERVITKEIQALRECILSIKAPANLEKDTEKKTLKDRLAAVEKWQWMAMGLIGGLTWIISNVNLSAIGNLFK